MPAEPVGDHSFDSVSTAASGLGRAQAWRSRGVRHGEPDGRERLDAGGIVGLEAWIAEQPWQPGPDGWMVPGDLQGWRFRLQAVPVGLLAPLTWAGIAAALLFLFVVRPAAGLFAFLGAPQPLVERAVIAFFGIRGLGSFYYLAYALNEEPFEGAAELWAVLGFTVLVSILLHGTTVTPAMRYLDQRRRAQGVLPLEAG